MGYVMQPRRILAALVATLITSPLVAAVPAATRPPARYHIGPYPIGVAAGNGSAWVSTHRDSILYRIDVRTVATAYTTKAVVMGIISFNP